MGRGARAEAGIAAGASKSPETPPGVRIWRAIEASPQALAALSKGIKGFRRRAVLQEYLTTGKTQAELLPLARVRRPTTVSRQLARSMEIVYPYLPEQLREEYKTPKEALQARSRTQSEASRSRIRQGIDRERISEANLQRWKRYREVDKPQGKPAFSEQGLANIRANSGRRRRPAGR